LSGLIPQPFIDELLLRTELVELIDSYVPLKKRGNSYIACCPFHHEKSPSFNVVAKKQFYHCFGCGASGNALSFAMNYLNQGFPEAVATLASRLGLTVPKEGGSEKNQNNNSLYQLLSDINLYYQQNLKKEGTKAIEYLQNRGLTGAVAKLYQLGYASASWHQLEHTFSRQHKELLATGMLVKNEQGKIYDRYRDRIMFPIHDRHGRVVGFGGRVLEKEQKPKYLNSPETVIFHKSKELYGLYQIINKKKQNEVIIIVEGYMDVIALAQHGIDYAVATLGTATNEYHVQLLAKHSTQLIFCFDGDLAGKQAAWRGLETSLPHLSLGVDVRFMFLPEEHDPDSFIRQEGKTAFLELLKNSTPLHEFMFNQLVKQINLSTPSGKTQLVNATKPLLQKITEGSYKQLLLDHLARLTHIDNHRLSLLIDRSVEAKAAEQNTIIARSPIRVAVALLLQNPELYAANAKHIDIKLINNKDHHILLELLLHLERSPNANTASLIEIWRNTDYFESINKLVAWDHQVPDQELNREFIDIILFLQKQNKELIINKFIEKARKEGLSEEEQVNLQELLKKRHQQVTGEK
jgi:DNA primase